MYSAAMVERQPQYSMKTCIYIVHNCSDAQKERKKDKTTQHNTTQDLRQPFSKNLYIQVYMHVQLDVDVYTRRHVAVGKKFPRKQYQDFVCLHPYRDKAFCFVFSSSIAPSHGETDNNEAVIATLALTTHPHSNQHYMQSGMAQLTLLAIPTIPKLTNLTLTPLLESDWGP